jgi:hypothetical protein
MGARAPCPDGARASESFISARAAADREQAGRHLLSAAPQQLLHPLEQLAPHVPAQPSQSLIWPPSQSLICSQSPPSQFLIWPRSQSLILPPSQSVILPPSQSLICPPSQSLILPPSQSLILPPSQSLILPVTPSITPAPLAPPSYASTLGHSTCHRKKVRCGLWSALRGTSCRLTCRVSTSCIYHVGGSVCCTTSYIYIMQ